MFFTIARSSASCSVTHNSCSAVRSKRENKWCVVDSSDWSCEEKKKSPGVCVCVCLLCFQFVLGQAAPNNSLWHRLFVSGLFISVRWGLCLEECAFIRCCLGKRCRSQPRRWFVTPSTSGEPCLSTSGNVFLICIFSEAETKAPVRVN